jgi:serine carboxypeptidase-like clade 1
VRLRTRTAQDYSLYDPLVKVGHEDALDVRTKAYMQRSDVQQALHTNDGGRAPERAPWPGPVDGWTYTSRYAACNTRAPKGLASMVDVYREIAPQMAHGVLIANGDADPCVSYEGTRAAVHKVGFAEVQPYRPWFYNATAVEAAVLERKDVLWGPSVSRQNTGAQLGGYIVDYEHGLSFATVHGSGHSTAASNRTLVGSSVARMTRGHSASLWWQWCRRCGPMRASK